MDKELVEICDMAQDGLCLESKWGKCPYPEKENKCGLCVARYITEKLGYHK